jgi:hypothetical protein
MLLKKFVFPMMLKTTSSSSFSDTLTPTGITTPAIRPPRSLPLILTLKHYFSTHYQRAIEAHIDSLLP